MTDQKPVEWIDGEPLMEAVASAVHDRCEHHDSGLVIDDPRNIAAVAASVARAQIAAAVVEWCGQTVGCHVPTVDAIVELINPQSEPRVCGDQFIDRTCSLRDGRHLDGKHRDEFKGMWWDQSSVPPYSNRARLAGEVECACYPAPHRESDGTYSHWAGCPIADAQQQADITAP